jgi:hypothetical protein
MRLFISLFTRLFGAFVCFDYETFDYLAFGYVSFDCV